MGSIFFKIGIKKGYKNGVLISEEKIQGNAPKGF